MKNMKTFCGVIASLCCIVASSQATLLPNGNFEIPILGNVNPNNIPVGGTALTDWIVGGSGNVTVNHVGSGFSSLWPGNSSQWLDLTGDTGGAFIEQTFTTSINTKYLVTLDTFNGTLVYSTGGHPNHAFDVSATGNSTLQVSVTPGTQAFISYPFTATSASTTLRLTEATGFDSNAGWIDNVAVSAVPEPTTMIAGALLLLPFGASTLRILRRRTA